MDTHPFYKPRIYFTAAVTLAMGIFLVWDHFHGGVPSHHILAQEELPSISNWWGAVLIPLLTWFLLYRIQQRIDKNTASVVPANIRYGFVGALLFGITISILFTLGITDVPGYLMLSVLVVALFIPIYRAEYLLGFVIGMTYTFGPVLPIGIGTLLIALGAILYLLIRPAILWVFTKLTRSPG